MKKIFLFYASAGHGHEKAARAVQEALKTSDPALDVRFLDALTLVPKYFGRNYRESYLRMIRSFAWLWGFFYYTLDVRWIYFLVAPIRRWVNGAMARALETLLLAEQPEVIITTHFLAAEVAGNLKKKKKIASRIVNVVTDYLPHCIWTAPEIDWYIAAISEGKAQLIRRGVPEQRIRIAGIPTEKRFSTAVPREQMAGRLGLDAKAFTVLLTGGGAGVGSVEALCSRILALGPQLQVVVVCGTNASLESRLKALSSPRLKVLGFVNNMDEWMDCADLMVGKGGGLTVTECLCKHLPMIIYQPVPGQETRNAYCMERYQVGISAKTLDEVVAQVSSFLKDPAQLKEYKKCAQNIAKPHAASDIAALALSGEVNG